MLPKLIGDNVHVPCGAKSQVSTAAFEDAREDVKAFVGARAEDEVVFVRNTTEAINVLAAAHERALAGELARLRTELRAGRRPQLPGAVRASMGLGTTPADIDRLVDALRTIADSGPRWRYRHVAEHDEYETSPLRAA